MTEQPPPDYDIGDGQVLRRHSSHTVLVWCPFCWTRIEGEAGDHLEHCEKFENWGQDPSELPPNGTRTSSFGPGQGGSA